MIMNKNLVMVLLFALLPMIASAQAAGGQVKRSVNKQQTTRNTPPKKESTSQKQSKDDNKAGGNSHPVTKKSISVSYSSIDRNIGGITLGVSTKESVIEHLKNNGIPYELLEDGNVVMSFKDSSLEGVSWFAIYYRFYNNIVYRITYYKHSNNFDATRPKLDLEYSQLEKDLQAKYSKFKIAKKGEGTLSNNTFFKDNKTSLELSKGNNGDGYLLTLIFVDLNLAKKSKIQKYKDIY